MNGLTNERMSVDKYIETHKQFIHYCECIIFRNGEIMDAIPSHVQALSNVTNLSRDELMQTIPLSADPCKWLVDYTKCCAIWYEFGFYPEKISLSQQRTINRLIENGLLQHNFHGKSYREKHICERNERIFLGQATQEDLDEIS